jgi:hypothetical protein
MQRKAGVAGVQGPPAILSVIFFRYICIDDFFFFLMYDDDFFFFFFDV